MPRRPCNNATTPRAPEPIRTEEPPRRPSNFSWLSRLPRTLRRPDRSAGAFSPLATARDQSPRSENHPAQKSAPPHNDPLPHPPPRKPSNPRCLERNPCSPARRISATDPAAARPRVRWVPPSTAPPRPFAAPRPTGCSAMDNHSSRNQKFPPSPPTHPAPQTYTACNTAPPTHVCSQFAAPFPTRAS